MDETTKKIVKYAGFGFVQGLAIGLTSARLTTFRNERRVVYVGGITRKENDELVQYQFIFDAKDKELLELEQVK